MEEEKSSSPMSRLNSDFTFFAELCVGKNALCEMNTKFAV